MATYSDSNFNATRYNSMRPNYPDEFYETLLNYHESGHSPKSLVVDVGCGTGFATFKLLKYFDKVVGTDLSNTMIESCKRNTKEGQNIEFYVSPSEKFPSNFDDSSVDMITGAECAHWFDHAKFFKEAHRVLKPGGTLAYWFYKEPIFVDFPEANEIYDKYTYGSSRDLDPTCPFEKYMGPFWEQPGKNFLRTFLKGVDPPSDLFTDTVTVEHDPTHPNPKKTTLHISKVIRLIDLKNYVQSWSAYHSWMKTNGSIGDVAELFVEELKEKMGWTDDFEFTVTWATWYTFTRKME